MKFKHFHTDQNIKKYRVKLKKGAKNFKLTEEDLSNLTDLELMLPSWFVQDVLKPNKLLPWYLNFFGRIEEITLGDYR
jgi:hypothetical protein